ncbi:helix-turn-helix domain-containing protein [Streptomyces lincolnensis]|uniref:helix-turn-helix domain-containing protein n=1 Tax=Streptomyces lincolnensis TaxID=1915 RepID=UPI0037D61483
MTRPSPAPESARLAAALRELKERTGLSFVALEARTAYSKSSWDRYLNGRTLPPRQAVQALCRLAGEPEGRCLALWEIAEAASSGRAAEATRAPAEPVPAPVPSLEKGTVTEVPVPSGARTHAVTLLATLCVVLVGALAAALFLWSPGDGSSRSSVSPSAAAPLCEGAACEGKSPMAMHCGAQPDTLATYRTATGASLELRHSRMCGTSWARMWDTRIGDRLEMRADGPARSVRIADATDAKEYIYTYMTETRPGTTVRACFRPVAGGTEECFSGRVAKR